WKVAVERLLVAALNQDVVTVAKYHRAKPIPLRFEDPLITTRQLRHAFREHRQDRRVNRQLHALNLMRKAALTQRSTLMDKCRGSVCFAFGDQASRRAKRSSGRFPPLTMPTTFFPRSSSRNLIAAANGAAPEPSITCFASRASTRTASLISWSLTRTKSESNSQRILLVISNGTRVASPSCSVFIVGY